MKSHLHQLLAKGDGDGFGAVGGAELGEDDRQVVLDGDFGDSKLTGDLGIGEAAGDGVQDGRLPFGQFGRGRIQRDELARDR